MQYIGYYVCSGIELVPLYSFTNKIKAVVPDIYFNEAKRKRCILI